MSDTRRWLRELGLAQYVDAFESHDVDLELVPDLTDQALKDIGVSSTGHRMKLLRAARTVNSDGAEVLDEQALPEDAEIADEISGREAERRQLTVMFCDLVGSTHLSEVLDPEDLRALMEDYQRTCSSVVHRWEGHVAQYLGDGLMVYFGWPRAHEDDAERAVSAGLEVVAAVSALPAPSRLQVRIGIATGPVVVGETGDGDAAVPKAAVGKTPNLAARVQALAQADEVVIAPSSYQLVAGAFDCDDLGQQTLKGVAEPVRVWRVLTKSRAESRFEAHTAGSPTPMVGRESELAMLLERWEQAKDGEGQVLLLSGEPGIGKSRIIQVLSERLEADPHTVLQYQCSAHHTNSAFFPLIEQLGRAAGFRRQDSDDAKLDKLEAQLGQSSEDIVTNASLFASMMSLPVGRYPNLTLSPQKQKDRTIAALADRVAGLARHQPVLMLFEDAHWCDPTTLETLGAVIERARDQRVLLVTTHRPAFEPPWPRHPHMTAHSLNRLSRRQGADMVREVARGKLLPTKVLDQIVDKTDGVPLFVEELTTAVLEAGLFKQTDDTAELLRPTLSVPATLQDSLMARLDRLGPTKEVAQIGACIGRSFSHELMMVVSPWRKSELGEALQRLVESELVFRRGSPPEATYTFKHALVQDAAYGSLLRSRRRTVHARIARALMEPLVTSIAPPPEILAHHLTEADLLDEAAPVWLKAGQICLKNSALSEAIGHLTKGLAVNASRSSGTDRDLADMDLRATLGTAYTGMLGWASQELERALVPAMKLGKRLADDERLFSVVTRLWWHYATRCEFRDAFASIAEMNRLADEGKDAKKRLLACVCSLHCYCATGQYEAAARCGETIGQIYDFNAHKDLAAGFSHDPRSMALSWAGQYKWILGYPDQARRAATDSLHAARRVAHSFNLIWSLTGGLFAFVHCRDDTVARQWIPEARAIAKDQGLTFALRLCTSWEGLSLLSAGHHEEGLDLSETGNRGYRESGGVLTVPLHLNLRSLALGEKNETCDAHELADEAIAMAERTGHTTYLPESLRIKGELHRIQSEANEAQAESFFRKAMRTSKDQSAKSWELRAATSLARLWQSQGKRQEAHELLAPVFDWFTEGFDTLDLTEAKALLGELS